MYQQPYYAGQRITINPRSIVSTSVYEGGNWVRSKAQRLSECNLKDNNHKGKLSNKARSKLFNAVNWLVDSAKWKGIYSKVDKKHYYFKVNFITLTIPTQQNQDVTQKKINKLLHTFLSYARKYFHLRNYVWKIERGKHGHLHIHITTDTFIHYLKLRECWNRILQREGLLDNYYDRYGNYNPNSTDVHATKKVKNLAGYLCKYMSKDGNTTESYTGRLWGCNFHISKANKCSVIIQPDEVQEQCAQLFDNPFERLELFSKPDNMGTRYFFGYFFKLNEDDWRNVIKGKIKETYDHHRSSIRNNTSKADELYLTVDSYVQVKDSPAEALTFDVVSKNRKLDVQEKFEFSYN